jgi:hypothetical protein
MSLSTWEQQALDSIGDGFAASDPRLASLLITFSQLASGEQMPVREDIRRGSQRALRRSLRRRRGRPPGRPQRYLGLQRGAWLLWFAVTVAVIAMAFAMNRGTSPGRCTGSGLTSCAGSTRPAQLKPAPHGPAAIQIPLSTQMMTKG